jgi:DNA adenine methylase
MVGGGALFFELSKQKRFKKAFLGDTNPDLINAYRVIKSDVDGVIRELKSGRYIYDKKRYISIRSEEIDEKTPTERAARFIYLNRTCFNGLYRINQAGKFNVPFGKYNNPVICDSENLKEVSKALKTTRIMEKNFDFVLKEAKKGDVVYFDPPYFPSSKTSNFTSYTKDRFGIVDQTLLSIVVDQLSERGVSVVLSNSFAARDLYEGREIINLTGRSNIGGPTDYRHPIEEIMVFVNLER